MKDILREEAIHILANLKPTNTKSSFDAYVVGKAITMAIEALEQEPSKQECKNCKHYADNDETCLECEYEGVTRGYTKYEQEPSGDLISRQAAIKSIEERAKRIRNEDTLNGLAGAVAILFELPSVMPQPCEDAVSREAVDDILCLYSDGNGMIDARGAVRMVRELPSVNPQENTGHWIWQTEDKYQCSCCGEIIRVKEVMNEPQYITCPMCDAKMIEPQESEVNNG